MFKRNSTHLQTEMFGLLNTLPASLQKEAKNSEEYCFYQETESAATSGYAGFHSLKQVGKF